MLTFPIISGTFPFFQSLPKSTEGDPKIFLWYTSNIQVAIDNFQRIIIMEKKRYVWREENSEKKNSEFIDGIHTHRSELRGASISHTNPMSQPLRVSFYFQNAAGFSHSCALFRLPNQNKAIVARYALFAFRRRRLNADVSRNRFSR